MNPYSSRRAFFPNAPFTISILEKSANQIIEALNSGQVDAALVTTTPFQQIELTDKIPFRMRRTDPVTYHNITKVGHGAAPPFSAEFISEMWALAPRDQNLLPVSSLLPPGVEGGLTASKTLSAISNSTVSKSSRKIRIGILKPFFNDEYELHLKSVAQRVGLNFETVHISIDEFFAAFSGKTSQKMDYVLSAYSASEKFPSVFLELILHHHKLPRDLRPAALDSKVTLEALAKMQEHILGHQWVLPLFYSSDIVIHRENLDLGNQPRSEADLQFWRINENVGG
ncbi:MAG: hypothetical protein HC902_07120 [Calothrix sp. SM1_5_4]|nr:hypothetical protein [Calothrix sp. SM1_5_4]